MADGTIGVTNALFPDRLIDNNEMVNDAGATVQRQRVEDPELMALLRDVRNLLSRLNQTVRQGPAGFPAVQMTTQSASGGAVEVLASVNSVGTLGNVPVLQALGGPGITNANAAPPSHLLLNYLPVAMRQYGVAVS